MENEEIIMLKKKIKETEIKLVEYEKKNLEIERKIIEIEKKYNVQYYSQEKKEELTENISDNFIFEEYHTDYTCSGIGQIVFPKEGNTFQDAKNKALKEGAKMIVQPSRGKYWYIKGLPNKKYIHVDEIRNELNTNVKNNFKPRSSTWLIIEKNSEENYVIEDNEEKKSEENEEKKSEENEEKKSEENETMKSEENETIKSEENETMKSEENETMKSEENETMKSEENEIMKKMKKMKQKIFKMIK